MKEIRESQGGDLRAAGYQWEEPTDIRLLLFLGFAAAGTIGVMLCIDAFITIHRDPLRFAAMICFTAPAFFFAYYFHVEGRPRSLIFHANGSIEMPEGVPGFWFREWIGGHHECIVSIERVVDDGRNGSGKEYRAALYSRGGDVVRITGPVHPDMAHRVAVQLTKALQELRSSEAYLNAMESML